MTIFMEALLVTAVMVCGIPPAYGDAPAGRYVISTGIVYDKKTRLTWQQVVSQTTYTWSDAKTYCASASVQSALGGTGWRLPTIKELHTLVDYTQTSAPMIDRTAFPGIPQFSFFWSATPTAGLTGVAAGLDFNAIQSSDGTTTSHYARCVR